MHLFREESVRCHIFQTVPRNCDQFPFSTCSNSFSEAADQEVHGISLDDYFRNSMEMLGRLQLRCFSVMQKLGIKPYPAKLKGNDLHTRRLITPYWYMYIHMEQGCYNQSYRLKDSKVTQLLDPTIFNLDMRCDFQCLNVVKQCNSSVEVKKYQNSQIGEGANSPSPE